MKKYFIVYKTINIVNGKFYIGVHNTDDINDSYLGSGKILKYAIKKYGIENFKRDILKIFDNKEESYNYEKELVGKNLVENFECYNIKQGGFGGWDYVNNDADAKAKSVKSRTGEGNGMYKRNHTEESKIKIRKNRAGINKVPQSKIHKEKRRLAKCKTYHVIDPRETEFVVTDLVRFCADNDLPYKTMSKMPLRQRQPSRGKCLGWRCRFAN